MSSRHTQYDERAQLDLFRALPGDLAPRDAQDLMAYPFFSLAKSKRLAPIDFKAGSVKIRVEAVPEHGMATIWDADVLIWAASQIVEARDVGLRPSRLMATTPYEILNFIGRGVSLRDYDRLKAALDRLQSTTVATSIRQPTERRMHRFSWINEWKERADHRGRPLGLELILPDWFYGAVLDDALVLTIDRKYFDLTGGLERWLYRLVRKHGGKQEFGWSFDFPPPPRQVRQPLAAQTLRLRPARHRPPPAAAGLPRSPSSNASAARRSCPSHPPIPTRSASRAAVAARQLALGISCESSRAIRDRHLSCHRGPDSRAIGDRNRRFIALNQQLASPVTYLT